jgi:osmotically-inducible protein OsmY
VSQRATQAVIFCLLLTAGGCHRTPPPKPAADFARDAALETRVRALLSAEPVLRGEPIEVAVEEGGILLTGKVHRQEQKEKATEVAIRAGGSAPVKNELVVEG